MFKLFKPKLVNGHTKAELKRHCAGKFIENPEDLPIGTKVSVFQKETQGYWPSGDGWWERGNICRYGCMDRKAVNVDDGSYELDDVEVYLIKYYF